MALFSDKKPIILKEGSTAREQLRQMEEIRDQLSPQVQRQLERDMRLIKAGLAGEDRVMFELKNSHMELFILQDLHLEHEGLTAQIDFLVLTQQRNFVIECKNLVGNLEVNERGEFIREFEDGKREGIYSPITQNQRHLELIRSMREAHRGFFANLVAGNSFDDIYRSLVVLANPKTILRSRDAKREVLDAVIRGDQLINTIKAINGSRGPGREKAFRSVVQETAEWFLSQHKPKMIDYSSRYRSLAEQAATEKTTSKETESSLDDESVPRCPKCGAPMTKRVAKKGERSGKFFYGCSSYPRCRGIINIE